MDTEMNVQEQQEQTMRTQQLVENYLHDRLPQWFRDAFNERLMDDAELQSELDLREALEHGLKLEAAAGNIERWRSTVGEGGTRTSGSSSRSSWGIVGGRTALAASLVFAVASVVLLSQNLSLRSVGTIDISAPQVVEILATRGVDPAPVQIAGNEGAVVLMFDPGIEYDAYQASIVRDSDGSTIVSVDDLEPGVYGLLSVGVPAADLEPGTHEVIIAGLGNDGQYEEITRIRFNAI
jgi:hypothetical protein